MNLLTTRFLPLFFLVFYSFGTSAQRRSDTLFQDEYKSTSKRENAAYYILRDSESTVNGITSWIQKKYYITNELASSCPVVQKIENNKTAIVQNGIFKEYYKNGALESVSKRIDGKPQGEYQDFYENGSMKQMGKYKGWDSVYVYQHYDESGKEYLKNGNGLYKDYHEPLKNDCFYKIEDSLLTQSYVIDKVFKDTVYLTFEAHLEEIKRGKKLIKKLHKAKVPIELIRKYSGLGFKYRFVVMEDGSADRIDPLNMTDSTLNKIFIPIIKQNALFKPPTLRNGQKIKVYCHLPIRLLLQ